MVVKVSAGEWAYLSGAKRGLMLDPDLSVAEWAEQFRVLTSKGSAEPGKWRNERTPYLVEIMECLSPSHPCEYVVFMASTQVGKTEVLLNWSGEIIHLMPGPMLIVQSTLDSAETFSKQRLQPMIDETPELFDRVSKSRERDAGNTISMKEFGGGSINITTGNSEDSLRSKPIRFLALDEVDMYQGWSIPKAKERTETFSNRKMFAASSPKKKIDSIIAEEYSLSDQRMFFLPCPFCGKRQVLEWNFDHTKAGGIKFKHEDYNLVGEVYYQCKFCEKLIPEHHKQSMLLEGKWIPQNEKGEYPGFHLNQLYSLLGNSKWRGAVKKFLKFRALKKRGNVTYLALQEAFTNDVLAETWEAPVGKSSKWETLFDRREDYKIEPLNNKILMLVAGVDVQDDRLEVQVFGMGLDFETFCVELKSFYGKLSDPEVWAHLDTFLLKSYRHSCGQSMRIMATAIDTGGHYSAKVYEFVKSRYVPGERYVFGIKGASTYNQPIVKAPSKNQGIYLFSVGTDTAKNHIHECLKVDKPGPSYVHFPLYYPEGYFKQLCVEKLTTEWHKGKKRQVWKNPSRARNEALDTFVYAIAALFILQYWLEPNKSVTEMLEDLSHDENFTRQITENSVQANNTGIKTTAKPPGRRVLSKGVTV